MTDMDKMIASQDVAGIGKWLSDDIEITMHTSVFGKLQTAKANKQQYLELLTNGWAMAEDYHYQKENVEIHYLEGGKSANITATVYESMTINGTPVKDRTTESMIVELINGKVLITKMTGETVM